VITSGLAAVIVAYLLGSVSGAFIVTRLLTGKDIRKLGGGNAGARNVYTQFGIWASIPVAVIDIGKGIASVLIARYTFGAFPVFVLLAGLAAVAGHIWPVFLKFRGGNGLAASVGILAVLLPKELAVIIGIMIVLTVITRNPVLSLNIGFISLPVSIPFFEKSGQPWVFLWQPEVFSVLLIMIMVINFLPTALAAVSKAGNKEKLIAELVHTEESDSKQKNKKKK
jgi:acyl phosphate:glycerol-3-phosphate acyltransferase